MNSNEIILYQSDALANHIEVRPDASGEEDSVWLTQLKMMDLFQSTKQNIGLHINNIFKEGELHENSVVKEYLAVQLEGSSIARCQLFIRTQ